MMRINTLDIAHKLIQNSARGYTPPLNVFRISTPTGDRELV
jgi:hypothetical protein